ncbi:exported protein of unknown function [Cupriavidus taiwanensis]|nr:exported protein of unknown function [Cupriavidus taiwanensis]
MKELILAGAMLVSMLVIAAVAIIGVKRYDAKHERNDTE